MKMNVKTVMQFAGIAIGGVICGMSAASLGRECGRYEGAEIQAEWTSRAIGEAYSKQVASDIRNNINTKIGEYKNRK